MMPGTQLLNHYLAEISRIATEHGATIDKYVGDAILMFFGDPETRGMAAMKHGRKKGSRSSPCPSFRSAIHNAERSESRALAPKSIALPARG